MKLKNFKVVDGELKLAPGRYWVGDPCYVFPDENWMDFCHIISREGVLSENGIEFFYCGTAYGDGCYPVTKDGVRIGECGVDAGLLSIIPEKLVKRWKPKPNYHKDFGGVWVEVQSPAVVKASGNGDFEFGDFKVATSVDWDEEDTE